MMESKLQKILEVTNIDLQRASYKLWVSTKSYFRECQDIHSVT